MKRREHLGAFELMKSAEKKREKMRCSINSYEERMGDVSRKNQVKTVIDFDQDNCNSIKSLIVKKNTNIKVTSRFMNKKMLTFSKISIASFI